MLFMVWKNAVWVWHVLEGWTNKINGKTQRKNEIVYEYQISSCIINILGKFYNQVASDPATDCCEVGNACSMH